MLACALQHNPEAAASLLSQGDNSRHGQVFKLLVVIIAIKPNMLNPFSEATI